MTGELLWVMVVGMVAFQILILWMYLRSGGRWFPAALFHAVFNTVGGPFFFGMVEGPDLARLATIFSIGYALLAIVVLLVDRRLVTVSPTQGETLDRKDRTMSTVHLDIDTQDNDQKEKQ